jgi:hypothetical protein
MHLKRFQVQLCSELGAVILLCNICENEIQCWLLFEERRMQF